MIELRKVLNALLKTHHPQVYYQRATDKAVFPYIVYNLPNSFDNEQQEVFNLDIDVWSMGADTTTIETLTGQLWKAFNCYHHIDSNIQFTTYRANRLTLEDDNPDIKRRKLIFELRYFNRN